MQTPNVQDSGNRANNSFNSLTKGGGGGLVRPPNNMRDSDGDGDFANGTIPTPAQGNPYSRNGDRFVAATSRMPQPTPSVSSSRGPVPYVPMKRGR